MWKLGRCEIHSPRRKEVSMTAGDTVVIVLMIIQIGVALWAATKR